MNESTTLAFVLKTMPYKEKDRLVYAYTKEFGRLTFIAKGVNKMDSKNAAALQELSLVEMTIIPKKGISLLLKATIVNFYRHLKEDLDLQIYSSYMNEYVYKQEEDNVPDADLFELLESSFNALNNGYLPMLVYDLFNLAMLERSGTVLEVNHCVKCGEVKPIVSISIMDGGFICMDCFEQNQPSYSKEVLKLFRHMQLLKIKNIDKLNYNEESLKEVNKIIEAFVEEYSGIYFQTKKFMT